MTIAQHSDFYAESTERAGLFSERWIRRLCYYELIGLIVLCSNFAVFLRRTIEANVTDPGLKNVLEAPIGATQQLMHWVIGNQTDDFFGRAMTCAFILLWLFLALLVIFALRERDGRMLFCGVAGSAVGYATVHLVAWGAIALAIIVGGTLFVVRWIGAALIAVAVFLTHYLWPIFVIAAVAVVVFAAYRFRNEILSLLRQWAQFLRKYAVGVVALALAVWLLTKVFPTLYRLIILPVINFLRMILTPVFLVLGFLFKWAVLIIVGALLIGAALATAISSIALVGGLLVSQLQAGWHAARSRPLMLVAGFAIGSSLCLIVIVGMANQPVADTLNQAWLHSLPFSGAFHGSTHVLTDSFTFALPAAVKKFAFAYLTNLQAPAFDSLIFMVVVALAALSMCLRMASIEPVEDEDVTVQFVATEYAIMAGGIFVGVFILAMMALSGGSHSSS